MRSEISQQQLVSPAQPSSAATLPEAQAQALQPKAMLGKGNSRAELETPS